MNNIIDKLLKFFVFDRFFFYIYSTVTIYITIICAYCFFETKNLLYLVISILLSFLSGFSICTAIHMSLDRRIFKILVENEINRIRGERKNDATTKN